MARKKFLFDYTKFIAVHLVSATVETAAATDVVLTFLPASGVKAFSKCIDAEFTLSGKTVSGVTLDYDAGTVTVPVTVAYTAGAGFDLTFNPTQKGDTCIIAVTNNVE